MMTLLAAGMLALLILTALYAFGVFGTPYLDAFRFAFYLILVMFLVVIVFTLGDYPNQGYDPTPSGP
ncbi:hypothetical protein [Nitrospira sp. Nam80]|jgi:hypothetical protein